MPEDVSVGDKLRGVIKKLEPISVETELGFVSGIVVDIGDAFFEVKKNNDDVVIIAFEDVVKFDNKNYLETQRSFLREVKFSELKENNGEYYRFFLNAYRNQAVIKMQHAAREFLLRKRKKRQENAKPISKSKKEKVTARDSLAVMLEPLGEKYREHAEKIKQHNYLQLDFTDPLFELNLAKALRLKEINLNQMVMAKSIFEAKEWLHDYDYAGEQLHKFEFTEKSGPYQAREISYADDDQIERFHRSLEDENKWYFTINLTKSAEKMFFEWGIKNDFLISNARFRELLKLHVEKLPAEKSKEKSIFLDTLKKVDDENYTDILPDLRENYFSCYPETVDVQDVKAWHTAGFLVAVSEAFEENPFLVPSPDHKSDDVNSPTIAFVLTTLESENNLQRAVHGSEASMAIPVAGRLDVRMIRAFDEDLEKNAEKESALDVLNVTHGVLRRPLDEQARPVEITFPELNKTEKPHNYDACNFMLTYHDRFHCWRDGAIFKKFFRHERQLFTHKGVCQEKEFVMSKAIWVLSDMDIASGSVLRMYAKNKDHGNLNSMIYYFFIKTIDLLCSGEIKADVSSARADDSLILLHFVDMIKNAEKWDGFVREMQLPDSDKMTFQSIVDDEESFEGYPKLQHIGKIFQDYYKDDTLKQLITDCADKSNDSIILRAKLRNIPDANLLCDKIDRIGINRFFHWDRNAGLFFNDQFRNTLKDRPGINTLNMDDLSPQNIKESLSLCIQWLQVKKHIFDFFKSPSGSKSSEQMSQHEIDKHKKI